MEHIYSKSFHSDKLSKKESWMILAPFLVVLFLIPDFFALFIPSEQIVLAINTSIVIVCGLFWIGMLIFKAVRKNQFDWGIVFLMTFAILFYVSDYYIIPKLI